VDLDPDRAALDAVEHGGRNGGEHDASSIARCNARGSGREVLWSTLRRRCDSYLPGVRIAIASDHAGFRMKGLVTDHLRQGGHEVTDHGTDSEAPVDYPAFCAAAARAVVRGEADFGIVIGGSGQGEQIAANKVRGARAALCHDLTTAQLARSHNDANVLSLGGRLLGETLALAIVDEFLAGTFEGGRHVARVEQLVAIEQEECDG
jgi:ribose 5-phosphate isomerase B